MLKPKRYSQLAEINVVPYIDVMLVLLIIFMVTAPLLFQGVNVNLPNASAKLFDAKPPEPIVVSIDANGSYYLNIAPTPTAIISPQNLAKQVAQTLGSTAGRKERQVLVKGDQHVGYGKVMQAMVLLQRAGAEKVGLVTQPELEK